MPQFKKIAIVSAVFPPYRGGMGTVAYHHARLLAEMGHDVTVLTPDYGFDHPLTPSLVKEGAHIELVKSVFKYGNAAWVPSLKERLKEFDAVILEYPFFGGAGAVYRAKKKYGFKLVVYYHMDVVASGWKGLIFKYNTKWFLSRLVKTADLVLASSADYASHSSLGKFWQVESGKFKVLPIGVDINKFAFSDAPRQRIVLFVGGLDRAHYFKGVEYLIKAVSLVAGADFKVIIAGKGDLVETYKKLAKDLGIDNKVEFAGGVSDEKLVKLYQAAAATILPSIDQSEAFGIVLVESLACGTPVITSNLPGVRSVYENSVAGFSVPVKDVKALAEKISYMLDNPDKARAMGRAGRKLVEEKYDWERIGDNLKRIIESRNISKLIQNKDELMHAVRYIAIETSRLAEKITGKIFPVKSLTIFSHSQDEFGLLSGILAEMGKPFNYNNGPRVELYKPIEVDSNRITHLRIRKPDAERPQVGCNDFETDYEVFKNNYLEKQPNNLRLIKRPDYEMIEFHDQEFNVLAYVVSI